LGLLFDKPNHILFGEGNTWLSIIGASILAWSVYALVKKGVETAAIINMITTITKLVPITLFIVAAFIAFRWHTFTFDFTGLHFGQGHDLLTQVKSTMIVTVWVFIGIEGAVIVSNHAKHRKDIGRATILGLLTALTIYVLVTLLSMGVVSTPELAKMQNPSMAQVLSHILGPWGEIIIAIGLLISVSGAFLSWTLLATEAPYLAAKSGVFPTRFLTKNPQGTPTVSLTFTTWSIQFSLLAVVFLGGTYNHLLVVASEMILVPYFLVAAYTLKLAIVEKLSTKIWIIGIFSSIYGLWLLYASGLNNLLLSALLYLPGIFVYILAKKEHNQAIFNRQDSLILIALIVAAINACIQLLH
jgi:arginine:ornithine antiporter/lysine permease